MLLYKQRYLLSGDYLWWEQDTRQLGASREYWYLAAHASMIMARGPLVTDDGTGSIGSVLLLDVPDMDTARAFLEKEPFYSHGVYQESNFHRWRFGRVMDRFK